MKIRIESISASAAPAEDRLAKKVDTAIKQMSKSDTLSVYLVDNGKLLVELEKTGTGKFRLICGIVSPPLDLNLADLSVIVADGKDASAKHKVWAKGVEQRVTTRLKTMLSI